MKKILLTIIFILLGSFSIFPQNQISVSNNQLINTKIAILTTKDLDIRIEKNYLAKEQFKKETNVRLEKIKEVYYKTQLLAKELENKNLSSKSRINKETELKELKTQRELFIREIRKFYRQYNIEITQPLRDEFFYILNSIVTQNHFFLVDDSEIPNSILAVNTQINITNQCIKIVNDYFKTGIEPNLQIDIPESKVGLINTNEFKNEKTGINQVIAIKNIINSNIELENVNSKISKALQSYADEKGFNLIVDSSKNIPYNLQNIPVLDITNDFISYYNQVNP